MSYQDTKKIIFFTAGTHFMVHIYENCFSGILKDLQKEWGTDYTAMGNIGLPLFLLFGLMAIPGGWLSDRLGSKKILLTCLFGAAAASLAASFTREIAGIHPMVVLSSLLALLGLFTGLYHPAGLSFISRGVEKKGAAMGIHGILGNLGLAIAPFAASWLAHSFGWRNAFFTLAFPAAILGTAFWLTRFEPQRGTGKSDGTLSWRELFPHDKKANLLPPILVLYLIAGLNGLTYRSILVYLPSYFREQIGEASFLSLSGMVLASFLTTVILLVGAAGQWGGGRLADRAKPEKTYALAFLLSAPLVFGMGHLGGFALILSCFLFSGVYFSLQPMKNTLLAHYANPKAQGLTYGFIFFLEFGIGSFGSSLGGVVADRWGLAAIFDCAAVLILIMTGLAWLIVPPAKAGGKE